jgi:hypothetical protein
MDEERDYEEFKQFVERLPEQERVAFIFSLWDDAVAQLERMARGESEDGARVSSEDRSLAAQFALFLRGELRGLVPTATEAMVRSAYAEGPDFQEVREEAAHALVVRGLLTRDELARLSQDQAIARARRRVEDRGGVDRVAQAG